jgi:hypothetical protein
MRLRKSHANSACWQNPEYDPKNIGIGWSLGSCTPVTRMRLAHRLRMVAHYADS